MAALIKGYQMICVMPENTSIGNAASAELYGARIIDLAGQREFEHGGGAGERACGRKSRSGR